MLMKFKTSDFREMLETVKSSIPTDSDVSFLREGLATVCLESSPNGQMSLQAHNFQSSLFSHGFPVECDQEIKIDIPSSWIISTIMKSPGETSSLETKDENEIQFKSGRFKTSSEYFEHINIRSGFLESDMGGIVFDHELDRMKLIDGLQYTSIFMAKDDVRYYLNGAAFDIRNGTLNIVATNGHILGVYKYNGELAIDPELKACHIIPNTSVIEIIRFLKNTNSPTAKIKYDNFAVEVQSEGNSRLFSMLVNGKYADWERVVNNTKQNHIFKICRSDMINVVDRVRSVSDSKKHIAIDLKIEKEQPDFISINLVEDLNVRRRKASETMPIVFDDPENLDMRINAEYLYKILSTTPTDDLFIGYSGAEESIKITSQNIDDYLSIAVPVRRNNIQ